MILQRDMPLHIGVSLLIFSLIHFMNTTCFMCKPTYLVGFLEKEVENR